MTDKNGEKIRSVGRAFDIVEYLIDAEGAGVSAVADALGVPDSTAHDYLGSLRGRGYVVKEAGEYRASMRFLSVGVRARERHPLYRVGRDEVGSLAAATGEFAGVLCEEDGEGVFLSTAAGEDAVDLDIRAGSRTPLHATAHGKCVLAALPAERLRELLDERGLPAETDRTVTERDALVEELETVRKRGHAHAAGERVPGVGGVAAPVETDDAVGAIGVVGPASRLTGERRAEVAERVVRAANVVAVNIRHE